ncbi:hypothetical protein LJ737_17995 [Hymenobacter sp. 15J16-1T3B]|uniref:hypothetical protein n=1 Tax=Hymenobacter sp. 15J16-1T3B TaxID=2886941 RepID=UPI001D0FD2F6|nr:hypothetical protein [Hymenobacter sp. 15J16-1T3B]MCC3159139.1 hypothetical protein [Hymenobacter sp. 15J16-1T3B]
MRHLYLLPLALLLPAAALASHDMGGQISYTSLGGNQYRVRIEHYLDATASASQSPQALMMTLVCKKNGCTNGGPGSFTADVQGTITNLAGPVCAGAPVLMLTAETTVTLPPARWTLSVDAENRAWVSGNLTSPDIRSLHLEATLFNLVAADNTSPRFADVALPYVVLGQEHRSSFAAFDADGDSLAYSLAPATYTTINSTPPASYPCPTNMPYRTFPAGTASDGATGQSGSYAAGQFSGSFPFPSYRVASGVATPWLNLNTSSGEFRALPTALGTYAVAVRVDEYRRLNGIPVLIGSVLREVPYTIVASANRNPSLSMSRGGTTLPLGQPLAVAPGQNVTLTFTGSDPDAGQALRLSSDVATLLPGATFQPNLVSPTAQFSWQVPATAPNGTYAFAVRVTDNACPLNGTEVRTVMLRVDNRLTAASTPARLAMPLPAFPVPFTDHVTFRLPAAQEQAVLITDGLGRAVARLRSRPDGSVTWQPGPVAAGVYFARTADGQQVARLVKAD